MARINPRNVHLRDQALAALAEQELMSTQMVSEAIGVDPNRPDAWRALDALAKAGRVERLDLGSRGMTWRRIWAKGEHRLSWTHLEALYELPDSTGRT